MWCFFKVVPALQWLQFKVSGSVRYFIVYTFMTRGLSGASLTTLSGLRVGPVFHRLDFRDSGPLRCFGSWTSLWCFTGCILRTQGRFPFPTLGTPPNLPPATPPGIGHPETPLHSPRTTVGPPSDPLGSPWGRPGTPLAFFLACLIACWRSCMFPCRARWLTASLATWLPAWSAGWLACWHACWLAACLAALRSARTLVTILWSAEGKCSNIEQSGAVLNNIEQYWAILSSLQLCWTIFGCLWQYWAALISIDQSWAVLSGIEQYRPYWATLRSIE